MIGGYCTSCGKYNRVWMVIENEGLSCPSCFDTDPPVKRLP